MRDPDFADLGRRLMQSGIAARHVDRALFELEDHYADLVEEGLETGMSSDDARARAIARLGDPGEFVRQMRARPELRSWAFRYPRAALLFYPVACLAALPAVPLIAGIEHAPQLARWGMSLLLAGAFTTTLLLVLQLSIVLG